MAHFKTVILVIDKKKEPSQTVKITYSVFNVAGKASIH